jgi:signal transduction histidine kinase
MLSTSKLYFRHLSQQVDANKFDELKQKALNLLDETMTSVRRVSHDLKPVVLERLGLVEAIANMADQLSESGGITVHFNNEWSCEMDKEYELNWFRIMQELLNNTIKHADANEITIGLSGDAEKVWLLYNDNGVGLKNNAVPKTGLGIQNIISRLSLMRGELKYNDNQESGISIVLYSDTRPRIIEKTYDAFYTTK